MKSNRYFVVPLFIFWILCGIILLSFSKSDIHIACNHVYSRLLDGLFYYLTFLGDGLFTVILVIILALFIKFRLSAALAAGAELTSIIIQVLKHFVFNSMQRPAKYFEGLYHLRFIPGVEQYYYYSFPSGHAACAFATFIIIAFSVKNNFIKLAMFLLALLIGYSRIYLSQHFLVDVYFGSVFGSVISAVSYWFFSRFTSPFWDKALWFKINCNVD
ncbi:MAG: phosphatase PAP2 family protein [Bacteroidia bacterium]|nr:phosphatase PAP2 family protein [Bacteroidia bacterium]